MKLQNLHRESKKTRHQTLAHNFTKYWPIFKIQNSERILRIGQYLVKLWARVWCLVFFLTHGVVVLLMLKYAPVPQLSPANVSKKLENTITQKKLVG